MLWSLPDLAQRASVSRLMAMLAAAKMSDASRRVIQSEAGLGISSGLGTGRCRRPGRLLLGRLAGCRPRLDLVAAGSAPSLGAGSAPPLPARLGALSRRA